LDLCALVEDTLSVLMLVAEEDRVRMNAVEVKLNSASSRAHRSAADHRALLFGSRLGKGVDAQRRGFEAAEAQRLAAEERTLIEARNGELVDELHNKIHELRTVTIGVGHEASASLRDLGSMDRNFDGAIQVLRKTHDKLQGFAKQPAAGNVVQMSLFCVFLFVLFYFLAPRMSFRSLWLGTKHAFSGGGALGASSFLAQASATTLSS